MRSIAVTGWPGVVEIALGSTNGLKKKVNEDFVEVTKVGDTTRVALADGHWGPEAAQIATELASEAPEPANESLIAEIENALYEEFGQETMDENDDLTPETSLLVFEIDRGQKLNLANYGDCRLLIIRQNKLLYQMETQPTWLGAFSKLGLRHRLPVAEATLSKTLDLQKGDLILAFTDGVDECVYQVPTLSVQDLIEATQANSAPENESESETQLTTSQIFTNIMTKVMIHGAEDNASLVVIKV